VSVIVVGLATGAVGAGATGPAQAVKISTSARDRQARRVEGMGNLLGVFCLILFQGKRSVPFVTLSAAKGLCLA
jgi:hypothetical protein